MTDISSILETMAQRHRMLAEAGKLNKETIFNALSASGVTHVCVSFDGEGDSGQIDNIAAYKGDVLTPLPEVKLMLQSVSWNTHQIVAEERPLADAIEYLCYDFLEQQHAGWENNDGAFGEFTLNVAARMVELEFNGRYSDVHTSTHSS